MTLEAVVFPQDPLITATATATTYASKDLYSSFGGGYYDDLDSEDQAIKPLLGVGDGDSLLEHYLQGPTSYDYCANHYYTPSSSASVMKEWEDTHASSPEAGTRGADHFQGGASSSSAPPPPPNPPPARDNNKRKRRRTRCSKNREEVENQRMTHIAVERNRRKQMNQYLSVLRSLMPPSYVQRVLSTFKYILQEFDFKWFTNIFQGDQASIIGGAINYVKELEQMLHAQEAAKRSNDFSSLPFADFFRFPQYSARPATQSSQSGDSVHFNESDELVANDDAGAVADVEVTLVESHANVNVRSKRRPRQLLKMVAAFETLRLTTVHLNVTTTAAAADDQMVLYSISVKVSSSTMIALI